MRVAWVADSGNADGLLGGAELTQAEFRAAAPTGVEVQLVGPDLDGIEDCEAACVFNSVTYPEQTIEALRGKRVVRYFNDVDPHSNPKLRRWLLDNATNVFCSPLHRERFPHDCEGGELIPPPVNLDRFRAAQNGHKREGAVSVGCWENPGKAPHRVMEWGPVDFYGGGPFAPPGSEQVSYDDLPALLARYETFVFLPTALEPFGRAVVEAWASGLKVITNRLLGARYWITEEPGKLETAAQDFWSLVCE